MLCDLPPKNESSDNVRLEIKKGGLDTYMPDNFLDSLDEKEEGEKRYHKSNFHYDEVRDTYICPEGQQLKRWVCNTIVKGRCRSSFTEGSLAGDVQ